MKVKAFRLPRVLVAAVAAGRTILRGAFSLAAAKRRTLFLATIATLSLAFLVYPHDAQMLAELHAPTFSQSAATMHTASLLGTWGDYPTYNLPLALILWAYGFWRNDRAWRRIAIVCFLGGTLAGLFDDCFRLTLGRPRPDAHMPDGFYGLHSAWHSRFQSFPSGHAAAVFGTAIALLLTKPWLGWLATGYALLVVWARMELYRHYPSDVIVGSAIGICFGWLVGRGAAVRFAARTFLN